MTSPWVKTVSLAVLASAFASFAIPYIIKYVRNQPEVDLLLERINRKNIPPLSSEELALLHCVVENEQLSTTFADIGGLREIKNKLFEETILPLQRPDLFRGNLASAKGILLYGPPGTGKTMLAKAIAKETDAVFIEVKLSSIVSKWYGETVKNATAIFSLAKKLQPSILFFDEIDSVFRERNQMDHETNHQMKCTFMTLWDGLTSEETNRVLVIGATNRPWDIDEAIRRRMPKQLLVEAPNEEQRREILKIILQRQEVSESDVNLDELARITAGYTGSDLHELCRDALQYPIREACFNVPRDKDLRDVTIRSSCLEDFKTAMKYIHPVNSDPKQFILYNRTRSGKSRSSS